MQINHINTAPTPIARLLDTDGSNANFLVRVAYEWDETTYVVHASIDAEWDDLLERVQSVWPRDEATHVVSVTVIN